MYYLEINPKNYIQKPLFTVKTTNKCENKISYNENSFKNRAFLSSCEASLFCTLSKTLFDCYWERFSVFPKVRLWDIADTKYIANWWRISSRHVDFLIVDSRKFFKPVVAIELNWKTHLKSKQRKIDEFKKDFFDIINVPLETIQNSEINRQSIIKQKIIWYIEEYRIEQPKLISKTNF
jgi:hypothetical protein